MNFNRFSFAHSKRYLYAFNCLYLHLLTSIYVCAVVVFLHSFHNNFPCEIAFLYFCISFFAFVLCILHFAFALLLQLCDVELLAATSVYELWPGRTDGRRDGTPRAGVSNGVVTIFYCLFTSVLCAIRESGVFPLTIRTHTHARNERDTKRRSCSRRSCCTTSCFKFLVVLLL